MRLFHFRIIFLLSFTGSYTLLKGQNTKLLDSLRNVIKLHPNDTSGVSALNQLAKTYWLFKPDSALPILRTSIWIAKKIKNKKWISGTLLFEAYTLGTLEKYDSALMLYKNAAEIAHEGKYFRNEGMSLSGIGNIYNASGDYNLALPFYMRALAAFDKTGDSVGIAQTYNSLGSLFESQGDYKLSLNYHFKALAIKEKKSSKSAIAMSYNNIGNVYSSLKDYRKALAFHLRALALRKEINHLSGMASSYVNIGIAYMKLNNISEGITFQEKAFEIYKQINDHYGMITSSLNMGTFYGKNKQYEKAGQFLFFAEEKIKLWNYKELELSILHALYDYYNATGDYKKALQYHVLHGQLKDSVFNTEKAATLNKLNTQYQTEKKENENKLLQKENELSARTIRQQKITFYLVAAALLLSLLFGISIFRGYHQKRKANLLILQQKAEVERQKHLVEEKQKELIDSITYARRIQRSLLTSEKYIEKCLKQRINNN